jgi:hypothetical protein
LNYTIGNCSCQEEMRKALPSNWKLPRSFDSSRPCFVWIQSLFLIA